MLSKPLIVVLPCALLCLAAACSGGSGPSTPVESAADTGPEPSEETPPDVPALPGLVGYDIPAISARGALAIADEPREPPWANETEDTIVAELSDLIDSTMNLVAVECATTWCGVVIDLPVGGDLSIRGLVGDRLQALFSISGMPVVTVYRPDGTRWIAIYIEIRRLV